MTQERMTQETMTMTRFRALIEAYGATPARWPAEERVEAQALLAAHEEARTLLVEEATLDRLLDAVPDLAPSAALKAKILARTSAERAGGGVVSRTIKMLWPDASSAWPAGVLAASMALGALIGIFAPTITEAGQELSAGDVVSYAFSAIDTSEWQ